MQEHIRRAHPEYYISKLPATEDSFALMINTPPSERPPPPPNQGVGPHGYGHDRNTYYGEDSSPPTPRTYDEAHSASMLPAASAAAALAQLHSHRPDSDWESEAEMMSENEERIKQHMRSTIELPGTNHDVKGDPYPPYHPPRPRELLPSMMARSPPGRSSTLPPIQRRDKPARPRKSSITQNARQPKHERTKSKEYSKRMSYDGRKAFSAEPQSAATAMGKRWEDLIDAATSATEEADDERNLTPVPQSPPFVNRSSLPPFPTSHFQSYIASPLQRALTPPPPDSAVQLFPSVESSIESTQSGQNFHIASQGLSDSSPTSSHPVQIYCAVCGGPSIAPSIKSPSTLSQFLGTYNRANVLHNVHTASATAPAALLIGDYLIGEDGLLVTPYRFETSIPNFEAVVGDSGCGAGGAG
ncbi:MAG: hypothetical protein M1827_006309 [Pycnora praestabilis]|nr:MAG: hypothetical protein M1827_006309 [Pycnora praestabilis]